MLEFFAGTLVGGFVGVVTMCLCITAGESDRHDERMFYTGKLRDFHQKSCCKISLCGGFFMPFRIDKYSALYYNIIIAL